MNGSPHLAAPEDGFTTVTNRKKRGKGTAIKSKNHAGGFKVNNSKNFQYQPVKQKNNDSIPSTSGTKTNEKEKVKEGEDNGVKLRNLFEKLNDITSVVDPNSDTGVTDQTNKSGFEPDPKQSEVRQVLHENNLSVCAILESHVDIVALTNICSKVFRCWEWSSNASLCTKGCRIILGWNKDVVDIVVVAQSDQAMHTKIFHKADNKFSPWILMGGFNVALNIEDRYNGSSSMNLGMCDFKDCVKCIEVMDINSFGLHYTWNQKPKGKNGILKKLDRIMGNIDFVEEFPSAYAIFQPYRIARRSWKKHKERWDFTLLTLSKEAQAVSITDCQAGNPCELISDPIVENEYSMIRGIKGQ
ncbi:hypothetical protein Tco_0617535 [Tanacetum coccineum]